MKYLYFLKSLNTKYTKVTKGKSIQLKNSPPLCVLRDLRVYALSHTIRETT